MQSGIPDGVPFSNQCGYAMPSSTADRQGGRRTGRGKRVELYHEFQKIAAEDLPLINVAEWGFITVRATACTTSPQSALGDVALGGYVDRRVTR